MKRNDFLRNMSLIGVGLSLTPWKLATAKPSIQRFRLPPASIHIPHGNFAVTGPKNLLIPDLNMECSVDLFLRNGITPCNDDLKVFSFQTDNQWMSISITRAGNRIVTENISGLEVNIESFDSEAFTVSKT